MEDLLINTLSTLGYPVRRQGSLGEKEEYPASFFTFWNNESFDAGHYDGNSAACIWDFDVNFYSTDISKTYSVLSESIDLLKQAGFIISGRGHDVASDEKSHTGRGYNALYRENQEVKKNEVY